MSGRRKGTPCGCNADPCGCSPKNHCVKAINNVSPDPNGDFNIKAGAGISINQTGDDEITIVNIATPSAFVEGKNIEFTPVGDDIEIGVVDDPVIDGTLTVNGDIIQNGAAYETHAEKVYTTNDYIYMRENAIAGLPTGSYSGFEVIKYDGTNDGRLVIDGDGIARVGDVGDEQPLLTREESANLNNGALLKWDGVNQKAVDEGTVGSDTKPIKIVNGVATEVTDALAKSDDLPIAITQGIKFNNNLKIQYGRVGVSAGASYVTVALPNQMSNDQYVVQATIIDSAGANLWSYALRVSAKSTSSFTVNTQLATNGDPWPFYAEVDWMVIGI